MTSALPHLGWAEWTIFGHYFLEAYAARPARYRPSTRVSPPEGSNADSRAKGRDFRRALYRRAELHAEQRKIVVGIASQESVFSGQSW